MFRYKPYFELLAVSYLAIRHKQRWHALPGCLNLMLFVISRAVFVSMAFINAQMRYHWKLQQPQIPHLLPPLNSFFP